MSLLLALAAAVAAQAASPTLTLREAQGLSPRELASRVLGMAGSAYREARVSSGERGAFGVSGSAFVDFAGPPRSAGFPGLCIANRLFVSFALAGERQAGLDWRMLLQRLDTNSVYRIVGDTNDRREGTDESERTEDQQCARAGPVLGPNGLNFFGSEGLTSADAYMAARMLQATIG